MSKITPSFAALENKLEKIARIMTQKFGVTVRIAGSQAFVNLESNSIMLPSLSDEAFGELAEFFDGFLDHECGHVQHTDKEYFSKEAMDADKVTHRITNTIEDVRIEQLASALPGVAQNLKKLNAKLFTWVEGKIANGEGDKLARLSYAIELCMRGEREVTAWAGDAHIGDIMPLIAPEIRQARRSTSTREALDIAKLIVAKLKALADGKPMPPDPSEGDEAEAGGAEAEDGDADEAQAGGKQKPKKPKKSEPEGDDDSEEEDDADGGDDKSGIEKSEGAGGDKSGDESGNDGTGTERGDGGDKTPTDAGAAPEGDGPPDTGGQPTGQDPSDSGASPRPQAPSAGGDEGDDADGADGEADSDADAAGADDTAGSPQPAGGEASEGPEQGAKGPSSRPAPDAHGDADGNGAKQGASVAHAPTPEPTKEARKEAKLLLTGGIGGGSLDTEAFVNDHILDVLEVPDHRGPDQYVVFSNEFDEETTFSLEQRARWTTEYAKLKQESRQATGAIANALDAALYARTQARWIGGADHGKHLDRNRAQAWMMGSEDERIFRYKEEGEKIDTCITLLWDCSGSMGSSSNPENKAALARIAAIAFHEALTRVGIPHEVLAFNSGGGSHPDLSRLVNEAHARGDDLLRYSRTDELNQHMVLVPYGQTDGRAICRITGEAANRDGESVLWAARRLAQRQETRKILIVGSDGQPAGARYPKTEKLYLKEVVRRVMGAGLEVYGIGIMDDSVKHYYPSWVVVRDAKELPRVVMTRLREALTGQKGRDDSATRRRSA